MKGLIGAQLGQRKGFESLLVENQLEIEKGIIIFYNKNVYHALRRKSLRPPPPYCWIPLTNVLSYLRTTRLV